MKSKTKVVKKYLNDCIRELSEISWLFSKTPGRDFTRNRKLPFADVVRTIVCMSGGSLTNELLDYFELDPDTPSASAFIQQRDKILPEAFETLFHMFTERVRPSALYKGYRLLAVDGSDIHIPSNKNDSDSFYPVVNGKKSYNLLHLNAMYDLCANIYSDAVIQKSRKKDEHKAFVNMVDRTDNDQPTIFMADRGYESYNNLAHVQEKGLNFLIRVKDISATGILKGIDLPDTAEFDLPFSLSLSRKQTNEMKQFYKIKNEYKFIPNKSTFDYLPKRSRKNIPVKPYILNFRIVRFKLINDTYEVIITNLSSEKFPPEELKRLYAMRWGIETSFRDLKYTVGLTMFHAKKMESIYQEIFASLTMYNFAQTVISSVIIPQKNTKHCYKINFSAAVHACRKYICDNISPPNLEALLQKHVVPIRADRKYVRDIKRQSSKGFIYRVA